MERRKIEIPEGVKTKVSVGEELDFPFDISPMHEGERIRKGEMYVELGGPKQPGFELVVALKPEEVEDMKVTLIGSDLDELEEGKAHPYAMIYYVAGSQVDPDLEPIIERRNHDFQNFIEGYMHLNQRYDVWVRISKEAVKKGLNSLTQIAKATMMLFKNEMPFIEKIEALYITDGELVEKLLKEYAMPIYDERDARIESLHDEDVEEFYSCTLCQSFAPTNVCIISPDRPSLCGAITWFDGRAAARVDPEGPNRAVPKGEVIDPIGGEYTGVNEFAKDESGGECERIKLHSFFEYPHTSCGCFEVIGFYMPEVDGIGWVHRGYGEPAPNGLTFSTMAGQTGGGKQIVGFLGVGVGYFRSKKFIQADGGWYRVVWMPKELKQRIEKYIPEDIRDKIATEEDAKTIDELKEFLKKVNHPVVTGVVRPVDGAKITEGWVEEKKEAEVEKEEMKVEETKPAAPQVSFTPSGISITPPGTPGIKLVIKNANIYIDKIVLRKKKEEE
ncbi:CO dehydrogenase/CO-methylating acetyl-CoA synthase complex subunit beta [Archaeoglobus veneficus]|uniref:Acetyl-CoA decarbonylase/synthase complex subunit beta n=1 Tax=Archaeoglobus veneficus (strain DSM 11195 / SNP6) TaxID=693661 RepID=F2KTA3_ARCVS|nr:CO dehydrogenase/CO-methylating acetyl-CoA synthase complex subunit beta [Archaeoglobus veneficus]AEA47133.1 CO dehydrogenase/acetyl-CoA synthase complex, beta subunit [Archaeoglobus veneficus SNP6]